MAFEYVLLAEGATQGRLHPGKATIGNVQSPHDGIPCVAFDFLMSRPSDGQGGYSAGPRAHRHLWIVKDVDRATPLLAKACSTDELLRLHLAFFRFEGDQDPNHFFSIFVNDAIVAAVHHHLLDVKSPEAAFIPFREKVSFRYATIEWSYEPGGVSATDFWDSRHGKV